MMFAEHSLDFAEGIYLAHRVRCGKQTFKKGTVLTNEDISVMREDGMSTVLGARLETDEIPEDRAAVLIAEMVAGKGVEMHTAKTGRCNLYSTHRGIAVIDTAMIDKINLASEAIAVATVRPWTVVQAGDSVASIKIIPFSISARLITDLAADLAAGVRPAVPLSVAPFVHHRVALLMTDSELVQDNVIDRTVDATRQRLAAVGSTLDSVLVCHHETAQIKSALLQAVSTGCDLLLVSGASVTKDRCDVIPKAMSEIGGVIHHFGMPVEPGNMLLMGELNRIPVLCIPGCARSARENGLDWILRRMAAKLPVTPKDIMLMGVGGLIDRKRREDHDEPSSHA
ncbi:molybdopterin-binding protein [Noviherbaspirillum sp.]|uniref:molybdopterin-binding protein n=1 Tax=Noviherbaspirillum sp. TaxID=1926288 RepID=UPI002B46BC2C|nr:molybdopterin-binding protein [Noviherbaspirillum sp.]HJV81986.1 molybdopterin-binding protein [Noviherbaspirillum sp.]